MKKLFIFLLLIASGATTLFGQSPNSFNYQAVARNADGTSITNRSIVVEATLRAGGPTGTIVWQEGHTSSTNDFGLFTIKIGEGNSTGSGSANTFSEIDWSSSTYFLSMRVDFGNGLVDMGTSKLLAVPVALYAKKGGDQTLTLNGRDLSISNGNSVQLPSSANDFDADSTNEIQTLSLNGFNLSISEGNSVQLPISANDNDADSSNEIQSISLNGNILTLSKSNSVTLPPDDDPDTTNEIQSMSLNGNILTLSKSNSITLPADDDPDTTNEIQQLSINGNTLSLSKSNSINLPVDLDPDSTNEIQTLSVTNDSLFLSGSNGVYLPSTWSKNGNDISYSAGKVGIGTMYSYHDSAMFNVVDSVKQNLPALMYLYSKGTDNFFKTSYGMYSIIQGTNGTNRSVFGEASGSFAAGNNIGVYGKATGTSKNFGVYGEAAGTSNASENVGVYGIAKLTGSTHNLGVQGWASGSSNYNRAIDGRTTGTGQHNEALFGASYGASQNGENIGVYGYADKSAYVNYGGLLETRGVGTWNIAAWASAVGSATDNYGLYVSSINATNNYTAYIEGNIYHTGSIISVSDSMFKEDVEGIESSLDIVNSLNPVTYVYKNEYEGVIDLPKEQQYGFLAQEMERVLPNMVQTVKKPVFNTDFDKNDPNARPEITGELVYKGINYVNLIPVLTKAIQEQQAIIDEQEQRIESLESQLLDIQRRLEKLEKE
jgi:hypothetical protein